MKHHRVLSSSVLVLLLVLALSWFVVAGIEEVQSSVSCVPGTQSCPASWDLVVPFMECCSEVRPDGSLYCFFGADNQNSVNANIPVGNYNYFFGGDVSAGWSSFLFEGRGI